MMACYHTASVACLLALSAGANVGGAMTQTPPPQPPVGEPAKEPAKQPAHEPTLDELLGLTPPAPPVPQGTTQAPTQAPNVPPEVGGPAADRADLDRKLAGDEDEDDFSRAVSLMGDAAKRLRDAKDAGLATQRVQEDVLKSLDKLISDAQKNQSKQKSNQKKPQQQQQSQPSPSQQQKSQQPGQVPSQAPMGGEPSVPREDGPGRTRAGNAASWGGLPARVRDALVEGINDRFSARYRQKTEEYYKRLAEDRTKGGANR
jgi:hypothetical protein